MQVVHARCCGLDVHQKTVVACVLLTEADGSVHKQVRTFGAMTPDLLALNDWLSALAVERVALESTGVYWQPVFNVLEAEHDVLLVNAAHMKAVPGHKTAIKDAEWIADLLRHGLLRPSFIPPQPVRDLRELRELTRYRQALLHERTQQVNRLHKLLETANLKLGAVASDILGRSGRDMLDALLAGETDPAVLAELARGRLRAKLPQLRAALEGRVQAQHRLLLRHLLVHIDFLEAQLEELTAEIETTLAPLAQAVQLLETIPCVGHTAATAIVSEIGADMSRFPSAKHLASWAGVCPGNKQSGGKRLSSETTHGSPWLRAVLGEIAWSIAHTSDTYLAAQYHRLARRCGKRKAIVAVSHTLLVVLYHMLRDQRPYEDLGADYFARLDATRLQRRYVRGLEQLGYAVTLAPAEVA
jgi:transposase